MNDEIKFMENEIEKVKKETGSPDVILLVDKTTLEKMKIESPEFVKHFDQVLMESWIPTRDKLYILPIGDMHNGIYKYSVNY